jgi:hypothetical protein
MINAHGNPTALPAALVHGFQQGFFVASFFAIGASIVSLIVIKAHKPTSRDVAQESEVEAEAEAALPGV